MNIFIQMHENIQQITFLSRLLNNINGYRNNARPVNRMLGLKGVILFLICVNIYQGINSCFTTILFHIFILLDVVKSKALDAQSYVAFAAEVPGFSSASNLCTPSF
jgi:hypothetical protein